MKVIVCSGDSHTCGQGSDNILSASKPVDPKNIYNTSGKGLAINVFDLESPSYVNLVRNAVCQHTGSTAQMLSAQTLIADYGCALQANERNLPIARIQKSLSLQNKWDMLVLFVCEQTVEATLQVYLDGQLSGEHTLYAPIPRYNEYAYRHIAIPCTGVKEVTLTAAKGDVLLRGIQAAKGEYVVINSGIGYCPSDRYANECFDYCITDLKPDIVIAEAHTINDWLALPSPQAHQQSLQNLVEKIQAQGTKVLLTSVSPICGNPYCEKFQLHYESYIAAAEKVGALPGVIFADAHAAFEKYLAGLDAQQRFDVLYVDDWHVNGKGHQIYADTILNKLLPLL